MMPRHSMTLSRHQNKLLQTPATLETLGSTSAVVDELGLLYPENRGNLRKNMASV